jgi:hypothetical protein
MRMEYATHGGLVVGPQNHRWPVSRVWVLKPGRRFRGGTDGMWWHRGVRVEAKLSHEERGGRRIDEKKLERIYP